MKTVKALSHKTTVILVDDHNLVRRGLGALLHSEGQYRVVAEARDGEEALRCARDVDAEVMILDLSMPRMNGLETLRRLREKNPCIKVLVLSMYDDEQFVLQAFRNGANGYILKQSLEDELFAALHAVEHDERYISPNLKDRAGASAGSAAELVCEELTRREREVLQLIADGNTTQDIANALGISWHTANRHRANLMHKLKVHNQIDLVYAGVRMGLMMMK
jgi:DNA-binding NarL/FixJ family response regulator